jgi:rRNA processing/ribosome biogenesis
MDPGHQLKALLQVQLASDASAVINLAYSLQALDETCFIANSHLAKWTSRIGSLLHSKDAGGRWAGLCLAHRSSLLSRNFMIDSAASWLPVALPILSVCALTIYLGIL